MSLQKILIKRALAHDTGTISTVVGIARLEVVEVRLGRRLKPSKGSISETITESMDFVSCVKIGRVYRALDPLGTTFDSEIRAARDGAEYQVTVDHSEHLEFIMPGADAVTLCQDYRA